jgi:multiple sugar transport system permease protein
MRFSRFFIFLALGSVAVTTALPFLWMLATAGKTEGRVFDGRWIPQRERFVRDGHQHLVEQLVVDPERPGLYRMQIASPQSDIEHALKASVLDLPGNRVLPAENGEFRYVARSSVRVLRCVRDATYLVRGKIVAKDIPLASSQLRIADFGLEANWRQNFWRVDNPRTETSEPVLCAVTLGSAIPSLAWPEGKCVDLPWESIRFDVGTQEAWFDGEVKGRLERVLEAPQYGMILERVDSSGQTLRRRHCGNEEEIIQRVTALGKTEHLALDGEEWVVVVKHPLWHRAGEFEVQLASKLPGSFAAASENHVILSGDSASREADGSVVWRIQTPVHVGQITSPKLVGDLRREQVLTIQESLIQPQPGGRWSVTLNGEIWDVLEKDLVEEGQYEVELLANADPALKGVAGNRFIVSSKSLWQPTGAGELARFSQPLRLRLVQKLQPRGYLATDDRDAQYRVTEDELTPVIRFKWSNFMQVWRAMPFARYYMNSIFVGVAVTALQVLTSAMAAFAFARLRFPGRDKLFFCYLATMMIPQAVTLVPLFILMKYWGWVDSYKVLILPVSFTAYGTFLLRQFFLGLPGALEDAARIDGCGWWGIFWRVALPLSSPALATLAILSFVGNWQSFLWPLVFTHSEDLRTLPLGLAAFQGEFGTAWTLLMSASLMSLLPLLAVFVTGQRFLISGIRLGAVKG